MTWRFLQARLQHDVTRGFLAAFDDCQTLIRWRFALRSSDGAFERERLEA